MDQGTEKWYSSSYYITPTEQFDDIRMVEIFHAGCLIQELFNLPLREAIDCWKKERKVSTCFMVYR